LFKNLKIIKLMRSTSLYIGAILQTNYFNLLGL